MAELTSPALDIEGVSLTPLRQIEDARGAVLHMLRRDDADFTGFGECYFSETRPGVVKAWKLHQRQTQNIAVPIGRIRLVIYDGRAGSPTCGRLAEMELGRPDRYVRVRIPPGLWYGFTALGTDSALLANCADLPHDPSECEVRDPAIANIPYVWERA